MLSSLSKTAAAVILGVVLVKENETISRVYDNVRRKILRIISEKASSENGAHLDAGQMERSSQ